LKAILIDTLAEQLEAGLARLHWLVEEVDMGPKIPAPFLDEILPRLDMIAGQRVRLLFLCGIWLGPSETSCL